MTIYKQLDNIYLEVETEGGGARWKKNGHLDNWVKESAELINFIIKVTQIQNSDSNSFKNIESITYLHKILVNVFLTCYPNEGNDCRDMFLYKFDDIVLAAGDSPPEGGHGGDGGDGHGGGGGEARPSRHQPPQVGADDVVEAGADSLRRELELVEQIRGEEVSGAEVAGEEEAGDGGGDERPGHREDQVRTGEADLQPLVAGHPSSRHADDV